jgi:hypothetical protein
VLALRATCRTLRDRVDLVLRLPPLSLLVDRLHAWLREHVGPAAPAIDDIEAARRLTLQASALAGRAHALLHQLRSGPAPSIIGFAHISTPTRHDTRHDTRTHDTTHAARHDTRGTTRDRLEEVVGEVCRDWKIGRAKRRALARLTRPDDDDDEAGAGQQPRLRMAHLAHRSDMVGRVACQAIDASLTLSLPGQPHGFSSFSLFFSLPFPRFPPAVRVVCVEQSWWRLVLCRS